MKCILMMISFLMSIGVAKATETVPLYAQGCLPYMENNVGYFNCGPEEKINLELVEHPGSNYLQADWEKLVELGKDRFKLSLKMEKFTLSDGLVVYVVTGTIRNEDGAPMASVSKPFYETDSIALNSYLPYGVRQAYPTFLFGSAKNMDERAHQLVMKNSIHFRN